MEKRRQKKEKIRVILGWILFIIYLITLSYFLFFSERYGRITGTVEYRYNLKPFQEIGRFWNYRDDFGMNVVIRNLAGNVLAFIPFGVFLPLLYKRSRTAWVTIFLTFLLSLSIETLQLVGKVGIFDVDDLLLNTIGGICGYSCYAVGAAIWRAVRKKKR